MNDFLPTGYELPDSTSGYMKFKLGENKFRVLSSAIVGYESWIDEDGKRKPLRWRIGEKMSVDKIGEDPKHFWAFVVWNYSNEKVQILEVTQKGIMRSIQTLTSDEDWGDPKQYDIVVTKVGEGLETEYQVNPKPKKELDAGVVRFYKDLNINLEALFDGKDPFKTEENITDDDIEDFQKLFDEQSVK